MMKEPSPFTDQLYDHSFDIDDILKAFCARQICYLRTTDGAIIEHSKKLEAKNKEKLFLIEPLPQSFLQELMLAPQRSQLSEDDNLQVTLWLSELKMENLPSIFETGVAGAWIRERVKDVALEWLDMNGLIPPSMRHVRDSSAFTSLGDNVKVKIEF